MEDYKLLRKIMFDGEGYITPTGLEDMLVNPLDFPAFYQYVLRKNDTPHNDIKPYRLVFMNGCEKVTLYKKLIDRYDIELDPSINQSVSLGYIFPWLSPAYFDWIYFFKRFTQIITRTTNLYGFFKVVEQSYSDDDGNSRSNFYLVATNDAYVEGVPVDCNFYCKLINVAENAYDEMDSPLSSFAYNVPIKGNVGKLFFKESSVIEKLRDEGINYREIAADEHVSKMKNVNANGDEITKVLEEESESHSLAYTPDKPPSKAALKLIGVLLVEMVYNDKKFKSQSDIINYIANVSNKRKLGNKVSGLGKENLEKLFSKAKTTLVEDIPHVKIDKHNYRRVTEAIDIENIIDKK